MSLNKETEAKPYICIKVDKKCFIHTNPAQSSQIYIFFKVKYKCLT